MAHKDIKDHAEAEGVEDIDKGSSSGYMKDGKITNDLPWTPRKNPVWSETGKEGKV